MLKMESPERKESGPSPLDQGSPFFKYLCGLSPIKPARSVHVVQTYAELSLPPPPAVFSSPTNPFKCSGRSKRGLVVSRTASTHVTVEAVGILGNTWGGDKENQPNQRYIPKSFVAAQVDGGDHSSLISSEYSRQQFLCPKIEHDNATDVCDETSPKFEFADVSDYLADPPPEGGLYAAASSSPVVRKSYVHRCSPSLVKNLDQEDDDHDVTGVKEDSLSPDYADCSNDATQFAQPNSATVQRTSVSKCHEIRDFVKTFRRERVVTQASGSSSDHEGSGSSGGERLSRLDQETEAMAFLVIGNAGGEGGSRNDWASCQSALPDLSRYQTPGFSSIERLASLAHLQTREDFELAASQTLENRRNADADVRNRELDDRKDVIAGGIVGQRGVRRRCLDFETSVLRKSVGGGGSRKSLGHKARSGSSAITTTSRIRSSVLCERAVATSDATNSAAGISGAADSHSHISMRPECISSGNRVLSPGLLRISRCGVQRGTDLTSSNQCGTDLAGLGKDPSSCSLGIPSGIGLHLNSLTGSISFSPTHKDFKQALSMTSATKGAVASLLGMPGLIASSSDKRSEEFSNNGLGVGAGCNNFSLGPAASSFGTGVLISVMERSRVTLREPPATSVAGEASRPDTLRSLTLGGSQYHEESRSTRSNGFEEKFASGDKKRLAHQDLLPQASENYGDEYDCLRSPKKRRKSPTLSGEKSGEGCKRCNCKKSKCLKLYCECFAAGTYCVGSCTCRDCFNKPEHEETVLSTRQQIESRNPLAFAPKIVHSGDASPKRGDEIIETPVSARHKRGCNCKKSLCLKKYCECYQAGVGCSEGCRCEGCKNMYGRKEAVEDSDDKETASDVLESGSMEDELELTRPGFHGGEGNVDQHLNNTKDLSPITPSLQYTGQSRAVGRVRSAGKKRSSSPLSHLQCVAKLPRSPGSATRSSTKFQSYDIAQQTSDLQQSMGGNSPISTPKLLRLNQLSPRWDGLGDICTLTPLPQPPLRPTPASISTLDKAGASPSFSCQSLERSSAYQPDDTLDSISKTSNPPFQHVSDQSSLSPLGLQNLQQHCNHPAPCTAAPPSLASLGSDSVKEGDGRSSHLSFLCEDDDTPDLLQYTDSINSPVVTKSCSPKQKRVSPPHIEGVRDRKRDGRVIFDLPARSSPGLRSGRKFILQSLPSLPPVTQGHTSNCPKQL